MCGLWEAGNLVLEIHFEKNTCIILEEGNNRMVLTTSVLMVGGGVIMTHTIYFIYLSKTCEIGKKKMKKQLSFPKVNISYLCIA